MFKHHPRRWAALFTGALVVAVIVGPGDVPGVLGTFFGLVLWSFVLAGIPWLVGKATRRPLNPTQYLATFATCMFIVAGLNVVAWRSNVAVPKDQPGDGEEENAGFASPHQAAMLGADEALLAFFRAGRAVDERDPARNTPLHYAAAAGQSRTVRLLLEQGSDVNAQGALDTTPLAQAAGRGYVDIVETLLRAGADPNAKGQFGATPLYVAAVGGHAEVAVLLLDAGADPAATDAFGASPAQVARESGHRQLADIILRRAVARVLGSDEGPPVP